MQLIDDSLVLSASDVVHGSTCEYAILRAWDAVRGRAPAVASDRDELDERVARLGGDHERRVLDALRAQHGSDGVCEIPLPRGNDAAMIRALHRQTIEAMRSGVPVVYQGTLFDGRLLGRPDFLVRFDAGSAGAAASYAVHDAKLARRAKVPALLQVAAYADVVDGAGIPVAPFAYLELGGGTSSAHRIDDIVPVYRERRARLEALLAEHDQRDEPVAWGDDLVRACGRCATCAAEVERHHDVLLVANLRGTQRARLRAVGIRTIDELADSSGPVRGIGAATLGVLRAQARLQADHPGPTDVEFELVDAAAIRALPAPDPGDIYFDFEGDPLWSGADPNDQGLEYLFGVVEQDTGEYRAFWAHDRAEERRALVDFLDYVTRRRAAYPQMHVYHYAAYEKTALGRLTGRHDVGGDILDALLRDGVLVDLYATVRQSVRVSQPSYSIKKLEPLYMGDDLRSGVDNAADSIVAYAAACHLREQGDVAGFTAGLDGIADYNAYDCRSTRELARWLRDRVTVDDAAANPTDVPPEAAASAEEPPEVDALRHQLLAIADRASADGRVDDATAVAMVAASLGYHRRENKPFWWAHYDRLRSPVDEWAESRDVLVSSSVVVERGWEATGGQKALRRRVRMAGSFPPGSTISAGSAMFVQYERPFPDGYAPPPDGVRATKDVGVLLKTGDDGAGVLVEERLSGGSPPHDRLPLAVTPGPPPDARSIEAALRELGDAVVAGGLHPQPGLDILRRQPPRLLGGGPLPTLSLERDDPVETLTTAVLALDRSYCAVQGPPGTGKSHIGARVIRRLVEEGWRVGVVAQSHAVVEGLLDKVVDAGLPAARVGKHRRDGASPCSFTVLKNNGHAGFLDEHDGTGCVIGGTAWDFTNTRRVSRGSLDLLVIDEAGQFSLANTLAVSVAAQRLLLLGDPQQLPQVSQGTHPLPVDDSALGWLLADHDTLPPERGFFLDRTWRLHPDLCAPVSRLSYEGRLSSCTPERHLDGFAPGVHTVLVEHTGNATESPEEADEVVRQVAGLLGRTWTDDGASAPLGEAGVLVVAAYNAQVALIRKRLTDAGYGGVRVGTVDKLQGREAPVVVVSMAASAVEDVPRGMGFLLSRNRVNVAVSRGKWAAIVIRSPRLTDYLPSSPGALAELGAFIGLCDASVDHPARPAAVGVAR